MDFRCRLGAALGLWVYFAALAAVAQASDHLDSPATVANPQADLSDVYAWISPDGRQLNLVMTVQGHTFSNKVQYTLHVDSGKAFGQTSATTSIDCRFDAVNAIQCRLGKLDSASGDPTNPAGLTGKNQRFRVYAGLRDDPFYNNVKGSQGAYKAALSAIAAGAPRDAAGCAAFPPALVGEIADQWRHSDGGPPVNLLANWTASAILARIRERPSEWFWVHKRWPRETYARDAAKAQPS